ncbi:MAG: YesU family protein [Clostridiales bacterium]|nr:YesU family protein [Clostridiales bacterium]
MKVFEKKLIYANPLSNERDIAPFRLEGQASLSFPNARLRMENALSPENGQRANYVLWCERDFPPSVEIEWDFYPLAEPGLAMLFFSAAGRGGEDLFSPLLAPRRGEYDSYKAGDINAYHVSYFRRGQREERAFHTCNLRKSHGFHLVAQGADPIPEVRDCTPPYRMRLRKAAGEIAFFINDLPIFHFLDDGLAYGKALGAGKAGFRQMAPLTAEYANLKVYALTAVNGSRN